MASSNNSLILSANDYEELWEILERQHIQEIVTEKNEEAQTVDDPMTAEQQGRLNAALNWGKNLIVSALRDTYETDELTSVNAPMELKTLNARLAEYYLEKRRYRGVEKQTHAWEELEAELTRYAKESSIFTLPLTRASGAVRSVRTSMASQFDRSHQFDNIIPSEEEPQTPDGYFTS